jgi:hypothetical protein
VKSNYKLFIGVVAGVLVGAVSNNAIQSQRA